jgi:uncharacterized protein with PQ loop repeat
MYLLLSNTFLAAIAAASNGDCKPLYTFAFFIIFVYCCVMYSIKYLISEISSDKPCALLNILSLPLLVVMLGHLSLYH